MHRIADLQLDIISLADNADIDPAQLAQQVQRRLRLLAQRQPQTVLLTAVADSFLDVLGHTIKTVRRTRTIDPLVGPLVIVVPHPVV